MASLKVRVRAAGGGPTIRVQVPAPWSLQALKDALAQLLAQPASSFRLSLNKKDEIDGPGTALLSSFGVINGDLLFYLNSTGDGEAPDVLARKEVTSGKEVSSTAQSQDTGEFQGGTVTTAGREDSQSHTGGEETATTIVRSIDPATLRRELCASAASERASLTQTTDSLVTRQPSSNDIATLEPPAASLNQEENTQQSRKETNMEVCNLGGTDAMEMEREEIGGFEAPGEVEMSHYSIPDLLGRVLLVEYGKVKERQEYLVLAVHAVMLETGFILAGPVDVVGQSGGWGLPVGWNGKGGLVNLKYTLPEIASGSQACVGEVILRCQIVGNALVVYGAIMGGRGSEVFRVSLPVSRFLHKDLTVEDVGNAGDALKIMTNTTEGRKHETTTMEGQNAEKQAIVENVVSLFCNVFELWQEVKDNLSLPLLTVMCEKAGLPPPASLKLLPTELKIKILECLPARALATIGCICSEFKFLACCDDLWKVRFKEEFGWPEGDKAPGGHGWKTAFAREWLHRKRREEERRQAERQLREEVFPGLLMRPPPIQPHFPGLIGGDYDRFPYLGGGLEGFRPRGRGGFWAGGFPGVLGVDDRGIPGNPTGGRLFLREIGIRPPRQQIEAPAGLVPPRFGRRLQSDIGVRPSGDLMDGSDGLLPGAGSQFGRDLRRDIGSTLPGDPMGGSDLSLPGTRHHYGRDLGTHPRDDF